MRTPYLPRNRPRSLPGALPTRLRRGFTIIELLVVMGIIAILMAILLPAVNNARRAAMEARARSELQSIITAVRSFMNDYSRMPGNTANYTQSGGNASLMNILRGMDDTANPRQILYLEIPERSLEEGNFRDPWGQSYGVALDVNYNNTLNISDSFDGNSISRTLQGTQVAAWSFGAPPHNAARWITSW